MEHPDDDAYVDSIWSDVNQLSLMDESLIIEEEDQILNESSCIESEDLEFDELSIVEERDTDSELSLNDSSIEETRDLRVGLQDVMYYVATMGYVNESLKISMLCRRFYKDEELFRVQTNHKFTINRLSRLHNACKNHSTNFLTVAVRLVGTGICDINAQTAICKNSALHFAILNHPESNECSPMIALLLSQPTIDVNVRNNPRYRNGGESPLHLAVKGNLLSVAAALLSSNAIAPIDVNQGDAGGRTPLFWACGQGRSAMCRMLLAQDGIEVNTMTKIRENALTYAVSSRSVSCVKLLLQKSETEVNVNVGEHGFTPLMIAVDNDFVEIVKLLLRRSDIDINAHPTSEDFATWTAHTFSASATMTELLLAHGPG